MIVDSAIKVYLYYKQVKLTPGECPQVTMVSKRGAMEKMRALAAKAKAIGN